MHQFLLMPAFTLNKNQHGLIRAKTLTLKCLSYLGPFVWNGLPDVCLSNNVHMFKNKVKKFLDTITRKNQDIDVYYGEITAIITSF